MSNQDQEPNWETVGAPDELERTKMHREYLRGDRNGWRYMYFKAIDEVDRWRIASFVLIPLTLVGLYEVISLILNHIKFV